MPRIARILCGIGLLVTACAAPVSVPIGSTATASELAKTSSPTATTEPTRTPRLLFPTLTPDPRATPVAVPGTSFVLRDEIVQSDLEVPWDIAFSPDGRMFVTERNRGVVDVFASGKPGAARLAQLLVDGVAWTAISEEDGLMGIALDPSFARNGFIYVCASRHDPELKDYLNQVIRYRFDGSAWTLDGFVIREGITANYLHNGCRIRFDDAGHLWVTMGDNWEFTPAQDPKSMLGKILRVNPDGSIPANNPLLPGTSARSAIFTLGHRNPQGIAIKGSDVYVIEQGPDIDDEINYVIPGANYGWPDLRATGGPERGMQDPIWTSGASTIAPCGGTFVSGAEWGAWSGSLFVVTLKAQSLRRFTASPNLAEQQDVLLVGKYGRLRAATQGPDGALYVSTSNRDLRGDNLKRPGDDRIIRIAPVPRAG